MIPIHDSARARTFPWVNLTIIAANIVVFLYEVSLSQQPLLGGGTQLDVFISHWGSVPACTLNAFGLHLLDFREAVGCSAQTHPGWTWFTAMFIQGSWLHIGGNMLFLWIFGDNVEDAMGHVRYAIFYVLAGGISAFSQMYANVDSLTPAIGASGAIAGVMGAYIVLFPRATVAVIIPIFFFIPFPLPAFVLIGFWFLIQLFSVSSLGQTAGTSVAYFAHIGGFIAGAALVHLFAAHRDRARPRRVRGPTDLR